MFSQAVDGLSVLQMGVLAPSVRPCRVRPLHRRDGPASPGVPPLTKCALALFGWSRRTLSIMSSASLIRPASAAADRPGAASVHRQQGKSR